MAKRRDKYTKYSKKLRDGGESVPSSKSITGENVGRYSFMRSGGRRGVRARARNNRIVDAYARKGLIQPSGGTTTNS